MSRARQDIINRIWRGRDPFLDLELDAPVAVTPPAFENALLDETISGVRPRVVVDVGAGLGGTTAAIARRLKADKIDGVVIAVDTYLGCATDWLDDDAFEALGHDGTIPSVYTRFALRIVRAGLGNYVTPLTADAATAAFVLARLGIAPNVVLIDLDRDFDTILAQLTVWWKRLAPGGALLGAGAQDPEVERAFKWFFAGQNGVTLDAQDAICRARKPLELVHAQPAAAAVAAVAAPAAALAPVMDDTTATIDPSRVAGKPAMLKEA
jgi:SAM-dependent methyltransferase